MDEISKSAQKREALRLKELGVALIQLSQETMDQLPLSDALKRALLAAKTIKAHGALRRQQQLIGKLMRIEDVECIEEALQQRQDDADAKTVLFHQLELIRDQLINQDKEALTLFIAEHPTTDVQQLRQLIKKASLEREKWVNVGASKALFRYLRECS